MLQYYDITMLQYYDITILRYYNITILRYYNITILRYYNITILQYYDITINLEGSRMRVFGLDSYRSMSRFCWHDDSAGSMNSGKFLNYQLIEFSTTSNYLISRRRIDWNVSRESDLLQAAVWTVQQSNPSKGDIFRTCPDRPWGPTSLLHNLYRAFTRG